MLNKIIIRFLSLLNNLFFKRSNNVQKKIVTRNKTLKNISSDLNVSIISNNCLGGCIYHDYHLRFNSPIINCYITLFEFPIFILNLPDFINGELRENIDKSLEFGFPVGSITLKNGLNINVFFNHYGSFTEAANKWNERKKRISFEKTIIIVDSFGKSLPETFIEQIIKISCLYPIICFYSEEKNPLIVQKYSFFKSLFVPLKSYDSRFYFSGKLCEYRGFSGTRYYEENNIVEEYLKKLCNKKVKNNIF